jgi:hypothetical protein
MSAAPCNRLAGVRAQSRLLLGLAVLVGLSAVLAAPARAAPPARRPPQLQDLSARDILQLPMATVQALSDGNKAILRARLEEARATQPRFETLTLPRATALAPRARAALPEVATRVVALDLGCRRSGLPPILYGLRRNDRLGLAYSPDSLFKGRPSLLAPTQLVLPDAYVNLARPLARISGPLALESAGPAPIRVEVLPSVPFGLIMDVDGRVLYVSAVLLELAASDDPGTSTAPLGHELTSRRDLGAAREVGSDDQDDGGGADRDRRDRDERAAPCILGTLCIACSRESCKDCGCQRELNSFCDRCDKWNRDCSQCNTSCARCNEDCGNSCTRCNSDCTKSCTQCNSDCNKSCAGCNSGCTRCNNDCNRCSNDCNNCNSECSRCSNDCNRCSSDCSRCGNECNSCNSECSRCNNDCGRCGGCSQCQLAVPLLPPPLPEPKGAALWARATRDSILLTLPPLVFLLLRRRLLRKRAAEPGEVSP